MHDSIACAKIGLPTQTPRLSRTSIIVLILFFMGISTNTQAEAQFLDFNGELSSINNHVGKGKWLVVMLWASDCHVCNQEAHQYVKFHAKHAAKDASVLGISLDGIGKKAEAETFIKQHKVNFPNLIGEPAHIAATYQNLTGSPWVGTPSFMVYTPKGELLGAQAGAIPPDLIESFIERESAAARTGS